MAKPKKNGTYLNVCIETQIYKNLEEYCYESGLSKTVAVERAIQSYLAEYRKTQKMLKEMGGKI